MNTPVPLARRTRLKDYILPALVALAGAGAAYVTGTLKTFVGAQVIASNDRSFRFRWSRRGLPRAHRLRAAA